jgi:thioredoxin reductase
MAEPAVAIVGAGPAGLAAALALRARGVEDVTVFERKASAGGTPRHCGHATFGLREFKRLLSGPAYVRRLLATAEGIDLRTRVTVTAISAMGELQLATPEGLATCAPARVILATGIREAARPARLVPGDRPWGVVSTGMLQQLIYLAGQRPFERPLILGTELVSFSALLTLRHAGIRPLAMIEPGPRTIARRPADLVARLALGVPVRCRTTLAEICGKARVESVVLGMPDGRREILPCDGVVITGGFVPEAALVRTSHLALDSRSGGPLIDQHWRCSDSHFYAAGNLLRPVESAGWAYREGWAAGLAVADDLQGLLPPPTRHLAVRVADPLRFTTPGRLAVPGRPPGPLHLKLRMARPAQGRFHLLVNGRHYWSSRRTTALPERRIGIACTLPELDDIGHLELIFEEPPRRVAKAGLP